MFYHIQISTKITLCILAHISTFKSNSQHTAVRLQPSVVVFKPHPLKTTKCTYVHVSVQPKYTVYISISHSKEWREKDTQLIPNSLFPYVWWRPAAGLGRGTLRWDLQSYLHKEAGFCPNTGKSLWDFIFTIVSIPSYMLAQRVSKLSSASCLQCVFLL